MIPIRGLRPPVVTAAEEVAQEAARPPLRNRWSAERDARLRKMWSAGQTSREIAEAFGDGTSRRAVLGRIHRLGLQRRLNPVSAS